MGFGDVSIFKETGLFPPLMKALVLAREQQGRVIIYTLAVINESGDIIPTKQDTFMTGYSNGFAVAVRGKKLFMLDKDGKEYSLPPVLQQSEVMIYQSDDGIFRVHFKKEEKTGYFKVGK